MPNNTITYSRLMSWKTFISTPLLLDKINSLISKGKISDLKSKEKISDLIPNICKAIEYRNIDEFYEYFDIIFQETFVKDIESYLQDIGKKNKFIIGSLHYGSGGIGFLEANPLQTIRRIFYILYSKNTR